MPKENKLEPNANKAVMVLYCGGGCRLSWPDEHKFIKSTEARFDGNVMEYKTLAEK